MRGCCADTASTCDGRHSMWENPTAVGEPHSKYMDSSYSMVVSGLILSYLDWLLYGDGPGGWCDECSYRLPLLLGLVSRKVI